MQVFSIEDNLHEVSNPFFFSGKKKRKIMISNFSSADSAHLMQVSLSKTCLTVCVSLCYLTNEVEDPYHEKRLYKFDPLKPHFYIVKLGFTGVYIIFLFLLRNIDCGYSLEPPHRGDSNEYPQSMF